MLILARWLVPILLASAACMSAPFSKRIQPYSAESPATGPAGVPGSGGTGAAGSFGSGGTMAGTTREGATQTPGGESPSSKRPRVVTDGGGAPMRSDDPIEGLSQ